jgi:iron complex outermembrane receptor protein
MLKPGIRVHLAFSALAFFLAASLFAQSSNGKISGVVRIVGGNPAVGATVTVTNQDTRVSRVVRAAAGGAYEVADLPQGVYSVAAEMQGFRKVTMADQRVSGGGAVTVDLTLEVKVTEAVTVTAMKREESIKDTPISVAAPTEETLRDRGAQSLEDVAANVANFDYQNLGPGQNQVAIRGVSSGQIARDQPGVKESVGSYLDESVVSLSLFTPDLDLFDMNRVEVLRGPQGTLFGSGSLSGTVRYITNQPELNVTRYFGEFAASGMTGGDAGGYAKVGINAPLGDKAAVRIVGYYDRSNGWIDSVQPDLSIKKNVNNGDTTGVRMAFDIAPIDGLTITPRFAYQDVKMNGWNREDIFNILANPYTTTRPAVTLGPRQDFTQIDEPYTDKFWLGDLNVKYNFGNNITLTSVTSYTDRNILVVRDAGALTSSITGGSIGLPESVYTLNSPLDDRTSANSWAEELRLSGGDSHFNWVGGGFWTDNTRHYTQRLFVDGFQDMTGIPTEGLRAPKDNLFWSELKYNLTQWAIFGEATYNFTDQWGFTGGLRYYNYHEDKKQIFDGIFAQDNTGTELVSQPGTTKADGVSPRFILTYKPTTDTNIYAQVAKGFRLGGINDPLNVPLCTPADLTTFQGHDSWKDETAWNYELGVKSNILGGRGSFGMSAFYEDLHDLQVTVTAGSCSSRLIFNVPHARSVGGELEFAAPLTDHLDLAMSAGYADSQLRSTVTSGGVVISGIVTGERLPGVPKFQTTLALTYTQLVGEGFIGYATGVYHHVGDRITQVGDDAPGFGVVNLNSFAPNTIGGPLTQGTFYFNGVLPAYDIINVRLGVRHSNFDVALFVNNLTDELALLALDRERGLRARVGYLTNQPRTIGLSSRIDF